MSKSRSQAADFNLARASDLIGTGQAVSNMTNGLVGGAELYRSAIVLATAALDAYVHGIVLDLAVDTILSRRVGGTPDRKFGLSLKALQEILSAPSDASRELAARTHLASRVSLETYQTPDDIGKALAMVGVPRVWVAAFGSDAGVMKQNVSLIVRRRNAIVHQCDADVLEPLSVTPIEGSDASHSVATVQKVIRGIDQVVSS